MLWKPIRQGYEMQDMPQVAGCEVLVTVINKCGQISVTTAFEGYGDFTWYTNDRTYMKNPKEHNNRLHHAYKILAWMPMPPAYNPYMVDGRYLIDDAERRVRTKRSTMEILRDVVPMIEEHMQETDDWRERHDRPD